MVDSTKLANVWEQVLIITKKEVNENLWKTWIQDATIPLSLSETCLEIGVPKDFVRDWIVKKYLDIIKKAVTQVLNRDIEVKVINLNLDSEQLPPEPAPAETILPLEKAAEINTYLDIDDSSEKPVNSDKTFPKSNNFPTFLNPKYTFDSFVIGNSNRFSHAAAQAVAEAPANAYNPLFLYGGVGLGKTHLMHAIGHRILQNNPQAKVLYISSEKFTNDLINSIRDNKPESFRQKYRSIDVLLVDDIQFLIRKERTQEEFFHTFNTLYESFKQIIISSDRPPRDIQTLEDRLRSRFESGLITDIKPPDLETRIAILRKKALVENIAIPNDVMVLIANRIDNNIRELEGALTRVIAFSSINQVPIDMNTATEALKDLFPNGRPHQITIVDIQNAICLYYKLKIEEMTAKKRSRNIAYPRQIAMYLCRELTDCSLPQIGQAFGGRDHTTVLHAYDKISREAQEDIRLQETLKDISKRLQNNNF